MIPDEVFGDTLIYCRQHLKAHTTGWCTVSVRDKVGLGTKDHKEAVEKCREWGFVLYQDPSKKPPQIPDTELVRILQSKIKSYDKAIDVLQSQLESRADEIERLKTQNEALQAENRDLLNFQDA